MNDDPDLTDVGNAERFVREHAGVLRYVGTWQTYVWCDGRRWRIDETGHAEHLAIETVRAIFNEARVDVDRALGALARAKEAGDADLESLHKERAREPKARLTWALESHSAARIRAMVSLAQSDPRIAVTHQQLDADPWLFNVENGTIDLRSGELRPHDPKDLITKIAHVAYDPTATCPTWTAFLDQAQAGNADMLDFIRRAKGYALTGAIRDHVLLFLYGPAGTGKSTFFRVMHAVLGDYAVRAPRTLLFSSRGDRHPTELATLHGARLVTCSEVDEGATFDEALVKDLTGGEAITARRMRENFWTFEPTHKLAIGGNYKPRVRNFDDAIRRRVRLIPWTIKPTTPDTKLFEKFGAELPGILAWAVRGCLEWQRSGLGEPELVRSATDAYQAEADPLREFFEGQCVFAPEARTPRVQIRQAYEVYCKENGAEPVKAKRFADGLRRRGVADANVRHAAKVMNGWRGVRLATDTERLATGADAVGSRYVEVSTSPLSDLRKNDSPNTGEQGEDTNTCQLPTDDEYDRAEREAIANEGEVLQ